MSDHIIRGYEPEKLFNYFEDISKIPRGSGNEKEIADFIESFAKERGLFCVRDSLDNVFVRKKATSGYENEEGILLQGHTDMVCEKNSGTEHDFLKDGLDLYIDKGWLRAKGTTLGGDDGVAVAIMLYVLDDNELCHPQIECLFTTGEETGLYGASGFDYSYVTSKKLINLDSEAEGIATVSCAGGDSLEFTVKAKRIPIPNFVRPIKISVKGLSGGHSGADIIFEKGNAAIILTRLLSMLYEKHPFSIVTISGGSRGNAIPREAEAVIFTSEPELTLDFVNEYTKTVMSWMPASDKKLKISAGKAKGSFFHMLTLADTSKILSLTAFMPNGVISREPSELSMVETSNNLGVIRDNGDEGIFINYHGRSSLDSKMDLLELTAKRAAKLLDIELNIDGRYSGWPMRADSALVRDFCEASKKVLGEDFEPKVMGIHAGLECGIICSAVSGLDAISIGPELKDIHSPSEKLELGSFERLFKIIKLMLEKKSR